MVFTNQDIGKRFIVAQQHVVAGFELLDEVLFQKQRFGFGARGQEHHRGGFKHHPRDTGRMPMVTRIARDPRLKIARLANVQHLALGVQHPVNAGGSVQRFQIGLNDFLAGLDDIAHFGR